MCGDNSAFALLLDFADAVQFAVSARPEFNFVQKQEQFNIFTVIPFVLQFESLPPVIKELVLARSPGVSPGCMDLGSM